VGRKLKPLQDRGTNLFHFRAPLDNPLCYDIMEKAYTIIRRESLSFDELCNNAIEEYVGRHFDGNYQTILGSYEPDGVKSEGQREQEIIRYYEKRCKDGYEVRLSEIKTRIREILGYEGNKVKVAADRIAEHLYELGVKIWR